MKFDIHSVVRPHILNLAPYSSARDEYTGKEGVFLDANENPIGSATPENWNRYPDPYQFAIKEKLAPIKGCRPTQIFLGNGSDEPIDLIIRLTCEPKVDNIIILPPTYGMYEVSASVNNVAIQKIPLTPDYQLNIDAILEAINSKTKLIFICSPNNPTGNSFSDESILNLLKNFNGLVVLDEAYIDFSTKESWLSELNDFPNLVIIQTLSKAYGLAGLRVGIAYASEEIISMLNKIKPPYNLNTSSQEIALKKLTQNTLTAQVKKIVSERENVVNVLKSITFIKQIFPSDSNFILIKVDDATLRYNQLIQAGIVVRNRSNQQLCENCLRITIGTKEENNQLITTFKSL